MIGDRYHHYNYEMLFDLQQDPLENVNLALNENYQQIIQQYRQLLKQSTINLK